MGNRKKKDSQYEAVKNHLLLNGDITSFEAIMLYSVTRLAVYIHTLRQEGYSIETERRHGVSAFGNASAYAKYILKGVPKK
jgi:biotin operon repressor